MQRLLVVDEVEFNTLFLELSFNGCGKSTLQNKDSWHHTYTYIYRKTNFLQQLFWETQLFSLYERTV